MFFYVQKLVYVEYTHPRNKNVKHEINHRLVTFQQIVIDEVLLNYSQIDRYRQIIRHEGRKTDTLSRYPQFDGSVIGFGGTFDTLQT